MDKSLLHVHRGNDIIKFTKCIILMKGDAGMSDNIYLLNLTVQGIKNIERKVRLDFYKKTVDKKFNPGKYRIKAIYGENGAGKSAIVAAVKIFQDLLIAENYLGQLKTQMFLKEMINKKQNRFEFNCEYLVKVENESSVCNYTVILSKNESDQYEIEKEILIKKNGNYSNNNYNCVFEVRRGELFYSNGTNDERLWIEKKTANLLSMNSIICVLTKNIEKNNYQITAWGEIISTYLMGALMKIYLGEDDTHESFFWEKMVFENKSVSRLMNYYFNLTNLMSIERKYISKESFDDYKESVNQLAEFIKIFKPDLVSIDIEKKENDDMYLCEMNLNYGDYVINKEFESTGIKKLIRLYDCFVVASMGGIVFVDEMDSNLNDVYLCKLIEYFMNYGKGQLCFTTHNLDPMSVLKTNKNSIDFLSSDNHLVPWVSRGNATPENCYKSGLIEDSPFNIDATDFVGILGV